MRSRIGRNVTLMHGVAAPEKHGVGHARAVEVRATRPRILAGINIRFCDVAEVVDIIAEHGRDVIFVFREHLIMAWRSREPLPAGGDGRFADELFPFEKISALIGDADHDFRRSRDSITIPITGRRTGRGRGGLAWHFRATGEERDYAQSNRASKQERAGHKVADSNVFLPGFNTKDSRPLRFQNRRQTPPRKNDAGRPRVVLAHAPSS